MYVTVEITMVVYSIICSGDENKMFHSSTVSDTLSGPNRLQMARDQNQPSNVFSPFLLMSDQIKSALHKCSFGFSSHLKLELCCAHYPPPLTHQG